VTPEPHARYPTAVPCPEQPSHLTDEFLIATRTCGDYGGERAEGEGRMGEGGHTDGDMVSLAL